MQRVGHEIEVLLPPGDIKPILVEVARFTLPVVGSTFAVGAIGSIDTLAIGTLT